MRPSKLDIWVKYHSLHRTISNSCDYLPPSKHSHQMATTRILLSCAPSGNVMQFNSIKLQYTSQGTTTRATGAIGYQVMALTTLIACSL